MPHAPINTAELAELLGRPIGVSLATPQDNARLRQSLAGSAEPLLIESLERLFEIARPPVELLRLVKDYAKSHLFTPGAISNDSAGERVAFRVIYLASIASASVRCGERISSLDDATLRKQFGWATRISALPESLRTLFAAARANAVKQRHDGSLSLEASDVANEGVGS